jgi:signal transduction histidine kinase
LAAHELKTPLALIRGEIELSDMAGRDLLLKDLDFMARQVQQLLQLAEASETKNYAFEPVDAAQVATDAACNLSRLGETCNVLIEIRKPETPVGIRADPGALFILVKNLVENAIHHSPAGQVVLVWIDPDGMTVRDAGKGIASEDLPRLFERFWRGAGANHAGAGLGLSICREIASAHGWRLEARSSPVPPGAEFRVAFR